MIEYRNVTDGLTNQFDLLEMNKEGKMNDRDNQHSSGIILGT